MSFWNSIWKRRLYNTLYLLEQDMIEEFLYKYTRTYSLKCLKLWNKLWSPISNKRKNIIYRRFILFVDAFWTQAQNRKYLLLF